MTEFGVNLRLAREQRGISLRQIALSTKISMVVLEALERDDFSHLPGGIFSRAFVRAYAIEVGLDPEEAVQQFLTKFGEVEAARGDTEVPVEVSEDDRAFLNRQRKAASILRIAAVVLLIVIIGGVSIWLTSRAKATPPPEPAPVAAPERSAAQPSGTTTPAPASSDATPDAPAIAIELVASDACWLEASADGKDAVKNTLAAGQKFNIAGDREVVLTVGNAGAIAWTLNGKPGKPIGRAREVQMVRVTRENLASLMR
jgi:cytoskeletal protein RodZ